MTRRTPSLRTLTGVLLAAVLLAGLGALSRVPYRTADAEHGWLRLSWRMRGERVDECRPLSPEEIEALPMHMRRPEVCEGRVAPYRLRYTVDGVLVEDTLVVAAGAKQDRPIYVFREIPLAPGRHRVEVEFSRILAGAASSPGNSAAGASRAGASVFAASVPQGAMSGDAPVSQDVASGDATASNDAVAGDPTSTSAGDDVASTHRVALTREFVVDAGRVVLVTLDPEGTALVLRQGEDSPAVGTTEEAGS